MNKDVIFKSLVVGLLFIIVLILNSAVKDIKQNTENTKYLTGQMEELINKK